IRDLIVTGVQTCALPIYVRFAFCSALAAALAGCTTYVERRSPRTVYSPPPPPVVAQTPAPDVSLAPPAAAPVVVTGQESPVVVRSEERRVGKERGAGGGA